MDPLGTTGSGESPVVMTYDEAIRYWHARINYEVRCADATDLKLERMRALLKPLGHPERHLRIVHVAGTKGKGSTAAFVESIARRAGYRTGLFTSPHLEHVGERVQVNRGAVSPAELTVLMTRLRGVIETLEARGQEGPTFFEVITALALLHFWQRRTELVILEVGLGGRYDSTNVCDPAVTSITSIGYDHMQQLGDTLEAIAFQKAGIVKRNVPVVLGPIDPGPRAVIAGIARSLAAPVVQAPRATGHALGLAGDHQQANAAVAVGIVTELRRQGMRISDAAVVAGLARIDWPGRIEVLHERPLVVLDSAHNLPSVLALLQTLPSLPGHTECRKNRHLIFAVSADKSYGAMLAALVPHFGAVTLTRFAENPRSVPAEALAEIVSDLPGNCSIFTAPDPASAWRSAWAATGPEGLVCVAGSIFLAGELRPTILAQIAPPLQPAR